MGISSIDARALAAPNLKDLPRRRRPLNSFRGAHAFWWAILPKRGNSPSPCNGLFALEEVSFSTDFLRDLCSANGQPNV
jgi:hypothetical protein